MSSEASLGGDLSRRGWSAEVGFQEGPGPLQVLQPGLGVNGEADRPAGVGDTPLDGLPDPPGGVGGELEPFAPVKFLDRTNEPQVAFLDEIEEWQTRGPIARCDGDHEPQIGVNEGAGRLLASADGLFEVTTAVAVVSLLELGSSLDSRLDQLRNSGLVLLGE